MKYAADPLFKAECLGYRAACSSIKWLEMANQDAKQKEIRSLNKEQEIGTVTHDCLHCRGTRDKGGAGGRTQKKEMGVRLQAVLRDVTPSPKDISAPCSEFKADFIQVACLFFHQAVRDG